MKKQTYLQINHNKEANCLSNERHEIVKFTILYIYSYINFSIFIFNIIIYICIYNVNTKKVEIPEIEFTASLVLL